MNKSTILVHCEEGLIKKITVSNANTVVYVSNESSPLLEEISLTAPPSINYIYQVVNDELMEVELNNIKRREQAQELEC